MFSSVAIPASRITVGFCPPPPPNSASNRSIAARSVDGSDTSPARTSHPRGNPAPSSDSASVTSGWLPPLLRAPEPQQLLVRTARIPSVRQIVENDRVRQLQQLPLPAEQPRLQLPPKPPQHIPRPVELLERHRSCHDPDPKAPARSCPPATTATPPARYSDGASSPPPRRWRSAHPGPAPPARAASPESPAPPALPGKRAPLLPNGSPHAPAYRGPPWPPLAPGPSSPAPAAPGPPRAAGAPGPRPPPEYPRAPATSAVGPPTAARSPEPHPATAASEPDSPRPGSTGSAHLGADPYRAGQAVTLRGIAVPGVGLGGADVHGGAGREAGRDAGSESRPKTPFTKETALHRS